MIQNYKKYAIIVAGGSGTRMNSTLPKQFISIGDRPVLMHTIQRFVDYSKDLEIILVLPSSQIKEWEKLCKEYHFNASLKIVSGGETRFQSVKNGLISINDSEGLVAIHDGVRPFVNRNIIEESFKSAKEFGSAIASVILKDSIRFVNGNVSKAADRKKFRLIQTPQTFQLSLIKKAFTLPESSDFTDDAGVLEQSGESVHLIDGAYHNIKITTPEDLIIGEAILKKFTF